MGSSGGSNAGEHALFGLHCLGLLLQIKAYYTQPIKPVLAPKQGYKQLHDKALLTHSKAIKPQTIKIKPGSYTPLL